jgi:hypothetical protein
MAVSRLAFAVVLATAIAGSTITAALAQGTWPADVGLATSTASPGDTVSFTGTISFGDDPPTRRDFEPCVVELDGGVLTSAACDWSDSGSISGSFVVPDDVATDTGVDVSVCWPDCLDDAVDDVLPDYWQANTDLQIVEAPTTPPTTPPTDPTTSLPTEVPTPVDTDREELADSDIPLAAAALAAMLGLLLLLGLLARTLWGRRRDADWVRKHVTVSTRTSPGPPAETRPRDEHDHDPIITVVAAEVRRSTAIEEERP